MKAFLFLLILSLPNLLFSQLHKIERVPIIEDGKSKLFPWAGGLNNPQFSDFDINKDGTLDLVVFDRHANKFLTFLNNGEVGEIDYEYTAAYDLMWPEDIIEWALIKDYNCDGNPDIFCHANGGMKVYSGFETADSYGFHLETEQLRYKDGQFDVNIWVAITDIPAIIDVDNDGDLDILSFALFGSSVDYYRNVSMELGYGCDSLTFQIASFCWGHFQENQGTNSIYLGACKGAPQQQNPNNSGGPHSGSTLTAFDNNCNGVKDLLLGHISSPHIIMVENGGNSANANMVDYDTIWPAYDESVDLPIFPAGFAVDIDNDSDRDILVAPNSKTASRNYGNVWLYENDGSCSQNPFSFVTDSFMVIDMLDVGEVSNATFFDHNADGLLDIVVSNFGYFRDGNTQLSSITLLENIGVDTMPEYQLVTRDWQNFSSLGINGMYLTFGDLDGDGDEDLIMGEDQGFVHYFANTAGAGNVANFQLTAPQFEGIDVGNNSTPYLFDMNSDGLLDLVIGRRENEGRIHYFPNFGTTNAPQFNQGNFDDNFGNISTAINFQINGFSTPTAAWRSNGELHLFTGMQDGKIRQYLVDTAELMGSIFDTVNLHYEMIDVGKRSCMAMADINNDGAMEYLLGNSRGGIDLFSAEIWDFPEPIDTVDTVIGLVEGVNALEWFIYPNPASEFLTIDFKQEVKSSFTLKIQDDLGKQILEQEIKAKTRLNISSLAAGVYFVSLSDIARNSRTRKVLVR